MFDDVSIRKRAEEVIPGTFKAFVSGCHAVVLSTQAASMPHICVTLLTEDDGNWFISKQGQFSSAWMAGVTGLFTEALSWLVRNAEPDVQASSGIQFGWRKINEQSREAR